MWANVSPPGVLNMSNVHPGMLKAAVYYIDMGMAPRVSRDWSGRQPVGD